MNNFDCSLFILTVHCSFEILICSRTKIMRTNEPGMNIFVTKHRATDRFSIHVLAYSRESVVTHLLLCIDRPWIDFSLLGCDLLFSCEKCISIYVKFRNTMLFQIRISKCLDINSKSVLKYSIMVFRDLLTQCYHHISNTDFEIPWCFKIHF
jgi:hypothetical protein